MILRFAEEGEEFHGKALKTLGRPTYTWERLGMALFTLHSLTLDQFDGVFLYQDGKNT